MQNPFLSRMGWPDSVTFIKAIGTRDEGRIWGKNPTAPTVLSIFTGIRIIIFFFYIEDFKLGC